MCRISDGTREVLYVLFTTLFFIWMITMGLLFLINSIPSSYPNAQTLSLAIGLSFDVAALTTWPTLFLILYWLARRRQWLFEREVARAGREDI